MIELTESEECKAECIDRGFNFCPSPDRSTGFCCGLEDCNRTDICSDDIKFPFSLKYWTCPFKSYCGEEFSVYADPSGMTQEFKPVTGTNNFDGDKVCNYMI